MKTIKQQELMDSFLDPLDNELKPLYQEIIACLSEHGYYPTKAKTNISFKHSLHNKQIAKMGFRVNKKKGASPFFALRFSACREYSQRFADIVSAVIIKYPSKTPGCINNSCNFCIGDPATHRYSFTFPNGEIKSNCGAYALEIPNITSCDVEEIKRLIKEEHNYLLKHESGRS